MKTTQQTKYTTSGGNVIPAKVMARVCEELAEGRDYQAVQVDHLRDYIPDSEDDLSEADDVISEAERRNLIS